MISKVDQLQFQVLRQQEVHDRNVGGVDFLLQEELDQRYHLMEEEQGLFFSQIAFEAVDEVDESTP